MDATLYASLKKEILKSCSTEQLIEIGEEVRAALASRSSETLIVTRSLSITACPQCGSTGNVVGHGRDAAGRQRFRCKRTPDGQGCGSTFNALTGTPFSRMRKPELWAEFIGHFNLKSSLSKIIDTGIKISRHTAFRWRHRFLKAFTPKEPESLSGIVEADEKYFLRSFKGHRGWKRQKPPEPRPPRYRGSGALLPGLSWQQVPVLTGIDRNHKHVDAVLESRTTDQIIEKLAPLIQPGAILCTDDFKGYAALADEVGAEHRVIETPKDTWLKKAVGHAPRRKGALGLGRVNSHHEMMETQVNRIFRGVSTEYLPNYLTMLRFDRHQPADPMKLLREALASPYG